MKKIRIAARAKRELKRLDLWWRANRDSKDLFLDEFEATVSLIRQFPTIGSPYHEASDDAVRRALMGRTRYHVYYVEDGDTLVIVSVWGAVRGRGPKLWSPDVPFAPTDCRGEDPTRRLRDARTETLPLRMIEQTGAAPMVREANHRWVPATRTRAGLPAWEEQGVRTPSPGR